MVLGCELGQRPQGARARNPSIYGVTKSQVRYHGSCAEVKYAQDRGNVG